VAVEGYCAGRRSGGGTRPRSARDGRIAAAPRRGRRSSPDGSRRGKRIQDEPADDAAARRKVSTIASSARSSRSAEADRGARLLDLAFGAIRCTRRADVQATARASSARSSACIQRQVGLGETSSQLRSARQRLFRRLSGGGTAPMRAGSEQTGARSSARLGAAWRGRSQRWIAIGTDHGRVARSTSPDRSPLDRRRLRAEAMATALVARDAGEASRRARATRTAFQRSRRAPARRADRHRAAPERRGRSRIRLF
jgi:hypothetical protein